MLLIHQERGTNMSNQVDVKKISTEGRNQNTMDIDLLSTTEMLVKINNEDKTVAYAVEKAIASFGVSI